MDKNPFFPTHQPRMSWWQLYVWRVIWQQFAHEWEILWAELALVVHELDVLFGHTLFDWCGHAHLACAIVCKHRKWRNLTNNASDQTIKTWMVFKATILHCKVRLDWRRSELMRLILFWIMPLVQDRLLDLLTSPANSQCAKDAPTLIKKKIE